MTLEVGDAEIDIRIADVDSLVTRTFDGAMIKNQNKVNLGSDSFIRLRFNVTYAEEVWLCHTAKLRDHTQSIVHGGMFATTM